MSKLISKLKDKKEQDISHQDCTDISEVVVFEIRNKDDMESFEKKGKIVEDYMVKIWFNNNEELWKKDLSEEEVNSRRENSEVSEKHIDIIEDLINEEISLEEAKNKLPQPSESALLKSMEAMRERFETYEKDLPEPAGKEDKENN